MTSPIEVGAIIAGKYRIERVLGEGGMGIVVFAVHEQLDQPFALKFLLPTLVSQADIVQRFLREARAAVRIQSEHVARVLDVGAEAGTPYMVMEYLEGGDLAEMLSQRGPLPPQEVVGYVLEACEAIAEAHAMGIVHRDLKPANLFVAKRPSGKPVVKVLDFGISKVPITGKDVALTSAKAVMGSPGYMSPEQMVEASHAGPRSDLWSLGVVLYELLTASLPFTGDTMPELVAAILGKTPRSVGDLRSNLPPGLDAVVMRCLLKAPGERFADIADLARALAPFGPPRAEQSVERIEHLLGRRDAGGPVDGLQVDVTGPRQDSRTFSPITAQTQPPARRFVLPAVALVVVGAGVAALVVVHPWSRWTAPTSASVLPRPDPPAATATATATGAAAAIASEPGVAPDPTGTAAVTAAPSAAAAPTWAWGGKPGMRSHGPARPAPSAVPAPSCHVASYFDADGNKHFKQVCP